MDFFGALFGPRQTKPTSPRTSRTAASATAASRRIARVNDTEAVDDARVAAGVEYSPSVTLPRVPMFYNIKIITGHVWQVNAVEDATYLDVKRLVEVREALSQCMHKLI